MEENEKHLKEIASLKQAAARSRKWADKNEATKIGYDPVKEHDRSVATRAYIGAKTKKMQSRATQYERRMEREIQEKEGLLQDIEQPVSLKLMPLSYYKERLISCKELSVRYEGAEDNVLKNLTFELVQGERVFTWRKRMWKIDADQDDFAAGKYETDWVWQSGYAADERKYAADKWWTDQYTAVRQQSREFACDSRRNLHGIQSGGVIY